MIHTGRMSQRRLGFKKKSEVLTTSSRTLTQLLTTILYSSLILAELETFQTRCICLLQNLILANERIFV